MKSNTAALLALLLVGASQQALAQSSPSPGPTPASQGGAKWTKVFEDSQRIYYLQAPPTGAGRTPRSGKILIASLVEYKIPQVIDAAQVGSLISHMQLDCDQGLVTTIDDTLYADAMGSGTVISTEPEDGPAHAPAQGSLAEVALKLGCAEK